jgi:hypothetical protein
MTFNNTKQETKKIPLMEENINNQFSQLQSLFLEFNKTYDELTHYNGKLTSINKKEFDSIRDT